MADPQEISQTPQKRPFFGLLSKGLAALDDFARQKNPAMPGGYANPVLPALSDLLSLPSMREFTENLAYGSPLFTGSGQTLTPKDSTVDGVLNALPLVGPLTKGLAKVTAKIPTPRPSQVNGLLGGLAGDDPSLWLSHGSNGNELLKGDSLIRELYNPSFAVTRDKLSQFKGAEAAIVPWPSKLDPKNAKTLLTATDSYNPRWQASAASRIDNLPWDLQGDLLSGLANSRVQEFVNQRLFEKFATPYPKQGIKQEGLASAPRAELPQLGKGLAGYQERWNPVENSSDWFSHRVLASPRFQSLEHFLSSPYGARLVGDTSGHSRLWSVESAASNLLDNLVIADGYGGYSSLTGGTGKTTPNIIKALASDTQPVELLSRKKDPQLSFLDTLYLNDPNQPGVTRPLTLDERKQIQKKAAELLQKTKTAPSEYAELKFYGPWQTSADNVAGIVARDHMSPDTLDQLYKAAKARGIPVEPVSNEKEATEAAQWFLSRKKGDTPPLARGLAGDMTNVFPGPSANAGDYAASVEAVKAAHKALKANPADSAALSAFQKAAKDFKLDSDLFVQAGKITNAESGAMAKWLDKELKGFTEPAPKTPGLSPSTEFNKTFFQTAGIDNPTEAAMKDANWLHKYMSLDSAKAGTWDYLPDSQFALLDQFASGGGHTKLKALLDDYKHISLTGTNADHDAALYKVLEEWDQIKPGAQPKTGSNFSQSDAQAAFSNKTLAELKAMDLTPLFGKFGHKDVLKAYDQYLADVAELEKMAAGKTPTLSTGLAATPKPSLAHPTFSETASPAEMMQAIADYHAQKPWYYSSMDFMDKYPHLTSEQAEALSNYSWSFNKAALDSEKDIPSITAQIMKAFAAKAK